MSFSSGTFSINTTGQPVVTGTTISTTVFNALTADLATGLTTCMLKDGTQTVTANLPMAGFKFTGLGTGSATTDSVTVAQVQGGTLSYLTSVSGTNTITATATPAAVLAVGQRYVFIPANTNTGATTLQIGSNSAGAVQSNAQALVGSELVANVPVEVVVSAATPVFQIINSAPFLDSRPLVVGATDQTKKVRIEADGITTATTRVWTAPDADVTLGLGAAAGVAQTFLGGDVALNNTANYFNICNTGAIGASGQVWKITASANMRDTAAAAQMRARIWDGSATVYQELTCTAPAASQDIQMVVCALVTLSGVTTFHLSCRDATATSGSVLTTGNAGTANKATWILAERMV